MVMLIVNIVGVLNFILLCCILLGLIILLLGVRGFGLWIGCYGRSRRGVYAFFLFLGLYYWIILFLGVLLFSNKGCYYWGIFSFVFF